MQRILILYATREGQTERVAMRIAGHLEESGAQVHVVNAQDNTALRGLEVQEFDLLVFGGSMHAGGIERELIAYINENVAEIRTKQRSFFLVLLSAATKNQTIRAEWLADARNKMAQQLPLTFDDTEMIAGALRYSKYSLPMKWLMRRIARKAGEGTDISRDYEYTDWQQVARYAQRLLAML